MKIFLNLLPPERKADIVRQVYWRFFVGQGLLVFFISFLAIFAMAALYFQVELGRKQLQIANKEQITLAHQEEYKKYEEKFENTNTKVRSAGAFVVLHTSFSDLLRQIEETLPENTKLEKISTQNYKVFLTGTTDTRDTFLILQENIKKNACFETVNAPLSNLFSETNVQFQVDFLVKSSCLRGVVPKL